MLKVLDIEADGETRRGLAILTAVRRGGHDGRKIEKIKTRANESVMPYYEVMNGMQVSDSIRILEITRNEADRFSRESRMTIPRIQPFRAGPRPMCSII